MNVASELCLDRKLLRAETFSVVRTSANLPSPTPVAREIIRLTQSEHASIAQIEHAIRADPVFVAQIVKVANSGRVSQRPLVSVKEALQVLGLASVRGIALGFSLLANSRKGTCRQFDYPGFWRQSLGNAVALQAIAERAGLGASDEMFTVGLLADIGKLMLASAFPDRYGRVLARIEANHLLLLEEEEDREFGLFSAELSSELLLEWGVPQVYAKAVVETRLPVGHPQGQRTAVFINSLWLARVMGSLIVQNGAGARDQLPTIFHVAARLSLDHDQLLELARQIGERWHSWGELLGLSGKQQLNIEKIAQSLSLQAPAFVPEKEDPPLRILVIDDDLAPRQFLTRILEDKGHEVYDAREGVEGLRLALELLPDVLITDWIMPGMDGLELIRRLRSQNAGQRIYALVVTARTGDEDLVEAFEAGADDYIPKPLQERTLLARLKAGQRIVQLQREADQQFQDLRAITTELSESNRLLQQVAITDALTNCPNRRYAVEFLQQEWAGATLRNTPLACLLIDVDWFKLINDQLGHDQGDRTLIQIAESLRRRLSGRDVLCRVGGDEFLIICPGADLTLAYRLGEMLCQTIAALGIRVQEKTCGVSVGIAVKTPLMSDYKDLMEAADKALYAAKRQGRGRAEAFVSSH